MERLADRIDSFNERFSLRENEKAVFSVEHIGFRWDEAASVGVLAGSRYGIVRVARDLVLTAAASGRREKECAARFSEDSDGLVILREMRNGAEEDTALAGREHWPARHESETLCLENILAEINRAACALCAGHGSPARMEWDGHNRAAFLIGSAFALVLLARELVQFALSASEGDGYEAGPLQGGRLVLALREHHI